MTNVRFYLLEHTKMEDELKYTYDVRPKEIHPSYEVSYHNIVDGSKTLIWYFIIGVLSGIIQISHKDNMYKSPFERFCIVLTSLCFCMFVTPSLLWFLELKFNVIIPIPVSFGIVFFMSKFGEPLLSTILRIIKETKWSELMYNLLTVFINNKKK